MTQLTAFFNFNFSDEETDSCHEFRFDVAGDISVFEQYYRDYEVFEDKAMNMESYGIHNVSAHAGDLEGFTSYEVAPEQYAELMEHWRQWYIARGFSCSDVREVPLNRDGNEKRLPKGEQARRNKVWDDLDEIRKRIFVL